MVTDASNLTSKTIGDYDLIEKIAEGGMGAIYKARHRATEEVVAIKVMPSHMATNKVLLRRFEQEHRVASRLNHPNIVRALEFGSTGTMPYLVMELVDGESLGAKLEREKRMPVNEAIRLISQVSQGLHRAHKEGLIHRDVKPDNILITQDGVAKLADLGLVKSVDADLNLTKTGRGLGTPHFMAPEQFRNAKHANVRCDVYSLGATLYVMVTGQLPFRSSGPLDAWMKKMNNELVRPRDVVPEIPERVEWAILRAMSSDPDKRPASCREFVEDLTGHSTRRAPAVETKDAVSDLWYLVYRDEEAAMHTVKGTRAAIRRSLKEGLLGDAENVRAARSKAGPFEPLKTYPEFRDLLIAADSSDSLSDSIDSRAPSRRGSEKSGHRRRSGETFGGELDTPTDPEDSVNEEATNAPPHVQLYDTSGGPTSDEWVKWVVLLVLAGAAGLTFFLFSSLMGS